MADKNDTKLDDTKLDTVKGPSKVDTLIDKWWSDNVAVLQQSVVEWGAAVEAKDELKKRITAAGPDLFK